MLRSRVEFDPEDDEGAAAGTSFRAGLRDGGKKAKGSQTPLHILLLCWTFVGDKAVVLNSEKEFASLEHGVQTAASRDGREKSLMDKVSVAVRSTSSTKPEEAKVKLVQAVQGQFVLAVLDRPRKFRTKWQTAVCDGPTASRDAKRDKRNKWIQVLSQIPHRWWRNVQAMCCCWKRRKGLNSTVTRESSPKVHRLLGLVVRVFLRKELVHMTEHLQLPQ